MKKYIAGFMMTLLLLSGLLTFAPLSMSKASAKSSIRLDQRKVTLRRTTSCKLKVKNTKKKVTWSSSDEAIAKVSKSGRVTALAEGNCEIYAQVSGKVLKCKIKVIAKGKTYKIKIPTCNQNSKGYPKGCEGVSLYMAMRGKGYLKGVSLKKFMSTMPKSSSNPEKGYVGDPRKGGGAKVNRGKRTTINPCPLAEWGKRYGNVESLQGASVKQLRAELEQGNPVVVYMTGGWNSPRWKKYSWGRAVTNNHALCLVGYNTSSEAYIVNDCSNGRGEYWVTRSKFERIYNARKYAVVVREPLPVEQESEQDMYAENG